MTQPDQAQHSGLARRLRELSLAILRDVPQHDLSRTAASTLARLQGLGPQRITALAEREVVSQPSMTGLVQRLEVQGYVSRTVDPDDGRASLVAITVAGARVVDARRAAQENAIAARIARLDSEDRHALASALPAISHYLENTENHVHA